MARKRTRQGGAEAFMDLVAMLPWWAGVAAALVSYFMLHRLAVGPAPASLQPGQMTGFAGRAMVSSLAYAAQFVVPVLCLAGAFGSYFRRRTRPGLVGQVTASGSAQALDGMSWREFELLVGEAFRMQGYTVTEQGGAQADGGVDLVLRKGKDTFLVQCKQWKAFKVGVDVIRQLYGVMAAEGAAGGFVVTSGTFTEGAQAFAHGRNLMLVDGAKLLGLIRQAKASLNPGALGTRPLRPGSSLSAAPAAAAPQCPACDASMVQRTALKGTRAGSKFWGCSRFPLCSGTR